jgi:hypothetical protein
MNARDELVKAVGDRKVAYGKVIRGDDPRDSEFQAVAFGSHEEFDAALPALDFEYDNGYGGQNLFGYVVFDDRSWLERHEYDGSERWDYKQTPSRDRVMTFTAAWW